MLDKVRGKGLTETNTGGFKQGFQLGKRIRRGYGLLL